MSELKQKVINALENLEYYDVVNENCESLEAELIADTIIDTLEKACLDLINRQKAENVELVEENQKLHKICDKAIKSYKETKSEAIKEFWEKLKTEARLRNHTNYGKNELATAHNEGVIITRQHTLVCGDNLVKEMAGTDK